MNKILSIILIGAILAIVPYFFFFIGFKINYIDTYQIKEYYNIIFVDNMPWDLYSYTALVLGVLFVIPRKLYVGAIVFLLLTGVSLAMFVPSVTKKVANDLFTKKNFHIKKGKHLYKGTLLYESRNHYYFLKDDTNRTIKFKKAEVEETY